MGSSFAKRKTKKIKEQKNSVEETESKSNRNADLRTRARFSSQLLQVNALDQEKKWTKIKITMSPEKKKVYGGKRRSQAAKDNRTVAPTPESAQRKRAKRKGNPQSTKHGFCSKTL